MATLVHVQNAHHMMVAVEPQEEGIEVHFADGAKGLIPFKDLQEINGLGDLAAVQLPNPYEMLLGNKRGHEVEIGWDFARHYADPTYQALASKAAAHAMQSLGARIRMFREKMGWTQEHLAESAGISRVTLNRIENGEQSPRYENLLGLSKALGVTFEDLVIQS